MNIVFIRDGFPGVSKTPQICKQEGNVLSPLVYFHKAKGASQEDFDAAVNFLIRQAEKTIKPK